MRYSAATASGAGANRASRTRRCSSAFRRFASFTGPKPRIVSGSCARATAMSIVSGRSSRQHRAHITDILLQQCPLQRPLMLPPEQIQSRAAQALAMLQHSEQRQRQPSRDRDFPPSSCRRVDPGDQWRRQMECRLCAIRRRRMQARHLVFVLVCHYAIQPFGDRSRQPTGLAENLRLARHHLAYQRAISSASARS